MKIELTKLPGVLVLEPIIWKDDRGYFFEQYNKFVFEEIGIDFNAIQINQVYSANKGILRGIGFQNNPYSQSKLISCVSGEIMDVVVDLRKGSPTFKKWISINIDSISKKMIFIPKGFGHGYLTKCDHVIVNFAVDNRYMKDYDISFKYNDPTINVQWGDVDERLMSEKDLNSPLFDYCNCNYKY